MLPLSRCRIGDGVGGKRRESDGEAGKERALARGDPGGFDLDELEVGAHFLGNLGNILRVRCGHDGRNQHPVCRHQGQAARLGGGVQG